MNEIPNVVRVPYKINELVVEFVRRVLIKAAEESGLPLLEQQIFADAMLAQYPATADRVWNDRDVTPRDNNPKLQTSDFNFLLYRQLLNENASIRAAARRGRKIQLRELKPVEGRVFSNSTIDELTKVELRKWQQDFIYRGGHLGDGREAPVSRQGLVPTLQEKAGQPDITWIPTIMRSKGWTQGATLMEEWQRRAAKIRPANPEDVPNNFGPPVLNVVTMDWILSGPFGWAEPAYNELMNNKMWKTENAKKEIGKMLRETGMTAQVQANRETKLNFGDLTSSNVIRIEEVYIQSKAVNRSSLASYNNPDALTAAIKDFNYHMAVKGEAKYTPNGIEVTVQEVGVYAKESYDFINDGTFYGPTGYDQPLGTWYYGEGLSEFIWITNNSFNNWREATGRGGDFLVYSDIKVIRLNPPDIFIVPF